MSLIIHGTTRADLTTVLQVARALDGRHDVAGERYEDCHQCGAVRNALEWTGAPDR